MRELIAPIVLHGLLLLAGAGSLRLAGVRVTSPGRALALTALSYLVGIATVFGIIQLLLVIGVPFGIFTVLIVAALLSIPAVLGAPAAIGPTLAGIRTHARPTVPVVVGLAIGLFWLYALYALASRPLVDYDAWAIWSYKAAIFFNLDHVPGEMFASRAFEFAHGDYPLVMPLWEAAHFRAIGTLDTSHVHSLLWLTLPSWVGGAIALAPRGAPRPVVLTLAGGAALLMIPPLLTGYADVPMAMFLSLGMLALGRWLVDRDRPDLILAVLLFGGAAGFKNEGFAGALMLFVALGLVLLRDPRGLRDAVVAGVAWLVAFVLPWKVWLAANDVRGDIDMGRAFDPSFLIDHIDRLGPTWRSLTLYVASGGLPTVILVAAVAIAAAWGVAGRVRWFAALALVLYTASLVIVYWVSPHEIGWHLATSAGRVVIALGMLGVSAVLLLTGAPAAVRVPVAAERDAARTPD